MNLPILIFDPHGEYSSLKVSNKEQQDEMGVKENPISVKTKIYVAADEQTKKSSDEMFQEKFGIDRESESLNVNITDLETYQIIHLLRSLYESSEAQSRILQAGWTDIIRGSRINRYN